MNGLRNLNEVLYALHMPQVVLAKLCEVHPNTACKWCKAGAAPAIVMKHLRLLLDMRRLVNETHFPV